MWKRLTITCQQLASLKPVTVVALGPQGCLSQDLCQAQNALSKSIRSLKYSSTQMATAVYSRSVFLPPQGPMQLITSPSGHHCWAVIVKSERTISSQLLPPNATPSSSIIYPRLLAMLSLTMTWLWLASFLTHGMLQLWVLLSLLLKWYQYRTWHLVSFQLFQPATAPPQTSMVPGQRPTVRQAFLCHQLHGQASSVQGYLHLVP